MNAIISHIAPIALPVLEKIIHAAKTGHFISFTYTDSKGKTSKKTYRFGGNIAAKFARDKQEMVREFVQQNPGVPFVVKGTEDMKDNWVKQAKKTGIREGILLFNNQVYVRGTDVKSRKSRTLKLASISL